MRKETITVDDTSYTVRELLAIEADDIDFNDKKNAIKKQIVLATGMSDDEYNTLTVRQRTIIIRKLNELNGLVTDFQ